MKAFQAYAKGYANRVEPTPQAAALAFFAANPKARKCNVTEGEVDGVFFTVRYGRASDGEWPLSWRDVTKKAAAELPANVTQGRQLS